MMFRFDDKILAEYPRQLIVFVVALIFIFDCMVTREGIFKYISFAPGVISGLVDISILLFVRYIQGYKAFVACACTLLICELSAYALTAIGLGAFCLIIAIWFAAVYYKLMNGKMNKQAEVIQ